MIQKIHSSSDNYIVECWNCQVEFDAMKAQWCGCSPVTPSKICPFCLKCFCDVPDEVKKKFWESAPTKLLQERETLMKPREMIGDMLIHSGHITPDQLIEALSHQKKTGMRLGSTLVVLEYVSESILNRYLGEQLGIPPMDLEKDKINMELVQEIGLEICRKYHLVPISKQKFRDHQILTVAMQDPPDVVAVNKLKELTDSKIYPMISSEAAITRILDLVEEASLTNLQTKEELLTEAHEYLNNLIKITLSKNAEGIYLEPTEKNYLIKYRAEDTLYELEPIAKNLGHALGSHLAELAKLDPSLRNISREGWFKHQINEHEAVAPQAIELLVRTIPISSGESFNISIVDINQLLEELDRLKLEPQEQAALSKCLEKSQGLMVISAPLGVNKTPALYSIINELVNLNKRIYTLEEEITCHLNNVNQTKIDPEMGYTYIKGLNTILMTDPEVVLLSSLNNLEITRLAFQTATDKQIIAGCSIFEKDVFSHWRGQGIPAVLVNSSLNCILELRSLHLLCPACKQAALLGEFEKSKLALDTNYKNIFQIYKPAGCNECNNTGYKGKANIAELIVLDDSLQKLILSNTAPWHLRQSNASKGFKTLKERGVNLLLKGEVSFEELLRSGCLD